MPGTGILDKLINQIADLMTGIGLNGSRLRWKWNNFKKRREEAAADARVRFRAVTAKHKMCPSCRSLVPTGSLNCPECGESRPDVSIESA